MTDATSENQVRRASERIAGLYAELTGEPLDSALRQQINPSLEEAGGSLLMLREKFLATASLHRPDPLPEEPPVPDENELQRRVLRQAHVERRITELQEKLQRLHALEQALQAARQYEAQAKEEAGQASTAMTKSAGPPIEPLKLPDLAPLDQDIRSLKQRLEDRTGVLRKLEADRLVLDDKKKRARGLAQAIDALESHPILRLKPDLGVMNEVLAEVAPEKKRWFPTIREAIHRQEQTIGDKPERLKEALSEIRELERQMAQREDPEDVSRQVDEMLRDLKEMTDRKLELEVQSHKAADAHKKRVAEREEGLRVYRERRKVFQEADERYRRAIGQTSRLDREREAVSSSLPEGAKEELEALRQELQRLKEDIGIRRGEVEWRRKWEGLKRLHDQKKADQDVWLQLAVAAERVHNERETQEKPRPRARKKRRTKKKTAKR